MTDSNPSEAALSAVRHWYGVKGAETSQAGEEEAFDLGFLSPKDGGGYTVTVRAAIHVPDMSELDVETDDMDYPARGRAFTLTAGQLARWFARFDPDTPVTVASPDETWWLNITACSGIDDPEEQCSLVLSTADDFDPRQLV